MTRTHLDDHLRHYYDSQQLDPTTLERLKQLALLNTRAEAPESPVSGSTGRRWIAARVATVAAAMAVLILIPLVFPGLRGAGVQGPDALSDAILREIALNHAKNLTVEFSAYGYSGLREQMHKLDFSLRPSRRLSDSGFQMLGGRYCSLQGRLAAQIKLEDEAGRTLTLYQTAFGEDFEGISELQRELDGIGIQIWREGDLLFGLAGSEI